MEFWEFVRNIGSLLGILVIFSGVLFWMFRMWSQGNNNAEDIKTIKEDVKIIKESLEALAKNTNK